MFWNQYKLHFDMVHNDTYFRLELRNEAGNNGGKTSKVVCRELLHLQPFFIFLCLLNSHTLLQGRTLPLLFFPLKTLQTVYVNLATPPCWRWEVEARAGAGVAALCSLWLWRRRRDRIQSLAVGGLVHWVGSSSSICSLLEATTLGVIVPDRDEKKGGWVGGCGLGVEDDIGGGEGKGRGSKA